MTVAPDPSKVADAAPTLARLMARIGERPYYFARDPYSVEQRTFEVAQAEMAAILKMRGWNGDLPFDAQIGRMTRTETNADLHWVGRPNFILMGTPIVLEQ